MKKLLITYILGDSILESKCYTAEIDLYTHDMSILSNAKQSADRLMLLLYSYHNEHHNEKTSPCITIINSLLLN